MRIVVGTGTKHGSATTLSAKTTKILGPGSGRGRAHVPQRAIV